MRTMEDIYERNKEINGYLCCDLSNFKNICTRIEEELAKEDTDLQVCMDEMCSLTGIYEEGTVIDYSKYRINTGSVYDRKFRIPSAPHLDSKEIIKSDFKIAKHQIESFFIEFFCDGAFEITKERLFMLPYWCVDWYWYDNQSRRFIDACKKANKLIGCKKDQEMSEYYAEESEQKRWKFEEIYYSDYNGGRVRASFKNEDDCMMWGYHHEAILEDDGLYWADTPAY